MLKYLIFFFLIATNAAQAQNTNLSLRSLSGIVIYKSHVSMLYNGQVTSDTLRFNRRESFFQWQRKMLKKTIIVNNNLSNKSVKSIPPPDEIGSYVIYKAEKDSMYSRKRTFIMAKAGSPGIFVKAHAPNIHWTITDSTKKIGHYTVKKATAHFHGRDYTAWFTPEIPVPYGPWKLVGLPGLILQAHDRSNSIRFSAKKIAFKDIKAIEIPPLTGKEKKINFAEYKNWMMHREKRLRRKLKELTLKRLKEMAHKSGHTLSPKIKIHIPPFTTKPMEIFNGSSDN